MKDKVKLCIKNSRKDCEFFILKTTVCGYSKYKCPFIGLRGNKHE